MKIECTCKCGQTVQVQMSDGEYATDILRNALIDYAMCAACSERQAVEFHNRERAEKEARRRWEIAQSYPRRLKDSLLEHYHLDYDPRHPGANPGLFDWVEQHKNGSLVIPGESGLGKSRILIRFGYEKLHDGLTVLYSPAPDLLDRIGEEFRTESRGARFLDWVMSFDLLIIDELLRDSGTPAKVQRLWQLIDRRYAMTDQKRNIEAGRWNPLYVKGADRRHGWQLWIAMNGTSAELDARFSQQQKAGGKPVIRRLREIGEIWTGNN